jgi:hypothetical protein
MQSYLFIGGGKDGISIPLASATDTMQLPVGVTSLETYIRDSLSVGRLSVVIYRHENMAPQQVLERFITQNNR